MEEKNIFKNKDIEILSQPLLTEEGFVNEACMNELKSAIKNTPKPHDRNQDNEWSKKRWTFKTHITSALAKYAVSQSPYACPDNLADVIKYLDACLEKEVDWTDSMRMAELSLSEISKLLYGILYEQGFIYFDNWNKSKKGDVEIQFTSRYDEEPNPDYDFIDLDALLSNVCVDIRNERRDADAFDEEFEKKYGKISDSD